MSHVHRQWHTLATTALLGTERTPASPTPAEGELGTLLAQAATRPAEQAVLDTAAILGQFRRAGFSPASGQHTPPAACPPETLRPCGLRAGRHLAQMLDGQHADILPEWLASAAEQGRFAPHALLPKLLDLGQRQTARRSAILPVLGERGRWLAAHNPEWAFAIGQSEQPEQIEATWQLGEKSSRRTLLAALRSRDPVQARELLASTWANEKAEERTTFLGILAEHLSLDDEPFLEAALDDRSSEVRRAAADMLARLPGSQLAERMRSYARPLLNLRRRMLRPTLLELALPEELTPAMRRDGIDLKPKGSLGERAWWVRQIIAAVPPAWWNEVLAATTADILAAAGQSEWKELLIPAWIEATRTFQSPSWAEALLASGALPANAEFETLIAVLPASQRETYLTRLIRENSPLVVPLLRNCAHAWSEPFARLVVRWYRSQISGNPRQPGWITLSLVRESARWLPPSLSEEFSEGWPTEGTSWSYWQGAVDSLLVVLQFRAEMLRALHETPRQ